MALLKQKSARRREVRRKIERMRPRWFGRLADHQVAYSILFVLIFTTFSSVLVQWGRQRLPYRQGQPVIQAMLARVAFDSVNKEETQVRRQQAFEKVAAVYKPNRTYLGLIRDKLNALAALAGNESIKSVADIPPQQRQSFPLDAGAFAQLRSYVTAEGNPTAHWNEIVDLFIDDLAGIVVLSHEQAETARYKTRAFKIVIQHPSLGEPERLNGRIISVTDKPQRLHNRISDIAEARFAKPLAQSIVALVMQKVEPTYLLNEVETPRRREAARLAVPSVMMAYQPNDLLVKPGDDQVRKFSELDIQLIKQERSAYRAALGPVHQMLMTGAGIGLVLIITIALWVYFWAYYRRVVDNAMRGLAVCALLLVCQGLALALTGFGPEAIYAGAIFPTLIAAIILGIAYDQRFALAVGVFHAALIVFGLNLSLGFAAVLVVGVATAVSRLRDVRNRSQLVLGGLWTGVAMAVCVILVGVVQRPMHLPDQWRSIMRDVLLVMSTGFVAGLFVQGILPGIERVFKVTTSMTLKDLNDASHPLLRRLAERAAGTYQHSLRIADLGEAAAESIGANGLMCRVGAMYHDIGKMNKAAYFVENQGGGPNRHNKLSPAMSLLIIVGHVKDGVEMAREFHLPPVIRHVIESHHGTTLVEYFFHAAKQQESGDNPATSEFEFRYPGPKPQTREAAIILLCDGIEGASRTLAEPTPVRLEQVVHKMANKRLLDGQFDECHLTLKELHRIEESITKTLCAIYHGRIAYPGDDKTQADSPAEQAPPGVTAAS